ncbi:MAG: ATP-binding protein [Candidatus Omnitrophica bacterium]|nr:ATP-binding protein [Candidatus Omnitrophota bacterium]
MLIKFSVKNYRSIQDRQTLSMAAASRDKSLPDHLIDPQAPGLSKIKLLKSAAIYGANASGKSNFFLAAKFMRDFVVRSATEIKPGDETGAVPFRLHSKNEKEPSEFEAIFIHEGIRYQYGFVLDKKKVNEEWLTAYPSGSPQRWFYREWDSEKNGYEWKCSSRFKGEKDSLMEKTRENGLFLSLAAQFNHEQASQVYKWFRNSFVFINFSGLNDFSQYTASLIEDSEDLRKEICRLLSKADLGITDIHIKKTKFDSSDFGPDFSEELKKALIDQLSDKDLYQWSCMHQNKETGENILFENDEESAGTVKIFSLLGPLLVSLIDGDSIFIDEIGAKMHPLLVRDVIRMFHNNQSNSKNAQLIFTTHDTTQLNKDILRRDQIWFTEKNDAGATILYPLTDFKPRKDESLQKGYLAGRYGAIPFLGDFTF